MSWRSKVEAQPPEPCASAARLSATLVWAPSGGLVEARLVHCTDKAYHAGRPCSSTAPLRASHLRVTHERLLHLVLVSADLHGFLHAHLAAASSGDGPLLFNASAAPAGPLAWHIEGTAAPPDCPAGSSAQAPFALSGTLAVRHGDSAAASRACVPRPPSASGSVPVLTGGCERGGGDGGGAAVVLARGLADGAPAGTDAECCGLGEAGRAGGGGRGAAASDGASCQRARLFSIGAAVGAGGVWCETLGLDWRPLAGGRRAPLRPYLGAAAHLILAKRAGTRRLQAPAAAPRAGGLFVPLTRAWLPC